MAVSSRKGERERERERDLDVACVTNGSLNTKAAGIDTLTFTFLSGKTSDQEIHRTREPEEGNKGSLVRRELFFPHSG